jgi:hypothetical protein
MMPKVSISQAALWGRIALVAGLAISVHLPTFAQRPVYADSVASQNERRIRRLPSGVPDMQGTWNFATMTPLERPRAFRDKSTFTDSEAAEFARQVLAERDSSLMTGGPEWWDDNTRAMKSNRTSLIIDPPDGLLPPLVPAAAARLAASERYRQERGSSTDSVEERSLEERCIMRWTAGPPIVPGPYNNNVQFVQTDDYVVISNEMIHDARVVPMDGRPHGAIRRWMGDSRGHWESATLVIDTINFTNKTAFRGSSEDLHLIERFTPIDNDRLRYEYTVIDSGTWTRAWTVMFPMRRTAEPIYEYACHEGNYIAMSGILKAARMQDGASAPTR